MAEEVSAASKRCLRLCQLPSGHGGPCSFSGPVCTCGSESFAGLECVCGASALLREEIERLTAERRALAYQEFIAYTLDYYGERMTRQWREHARSLLRDDPDA